MAGQGWKRPRWLGAVVAASVVAAACGQGGVGATASHPGPTASATPRPTPYRIDGIYDRLTDEQRVGQLLMVGLSSSDGSPAVVADAVTNHHAGGVVLYGTGWDSAQRVRLATGALQAMATQPATAGMPLYVAGNQEGGQHGSFQAFYGPGFQDIPAALDQGRMAPVSLEYGALDWGQELAGAGVNVDLAPVVDTVPPGRDASNQPVGAPRRELGHDPADVASHGAAFVRGMEAAGESVAVKHFPGLGRVTGNTDLTASGTSDSAATADDPYLRPFRAGWQAGAQMVMVSLADYPGIDPNNLAAFSAIVITRLLRGKLGFRGLVISDDLGATAAVQGVSPGDRATRFLRAGGDIVLTVRPDDVGPMAAAMLALMREDPAFRAQVAASVHRVVRAKLEAGLLPPG